MTDAERAVVAGALDWADERVRGSVLETACANVLVARCAKLVQERQASQQLRVNPEPGRTKLTRTQRQLVHELIQGWRVGTERANSSYRNTTQLRRLLPFVRANSHLIEELPRTPRGGWGYKLKDGVDPRKVEVP